MGFNCHVLVFYCQKVCSCIETFMLHASIITVWENNCHIDKNKKHKMSLIFIFNFLPSVWNMLFDILKTCLYFILCYFVLHVQLETTLITYFQLINSTFCLFPFFLYFFVKCFSCAAKIAPRLVLLVFFFFPCVIYIY